MDRKEFTRVVREVLQSLPEEFAAHLVHAEVVIDDAPSAAQVRGVGLDPHYDTLFGLYEGVPLPERGDASGTLPDKISIFYRPIVDACASTAEIRDEIRTTVLHEIAHFFGIDDEHRRFSSCGT